MTLASVTMVTPEQIKGAIRNVPNFPKPGIQFKDITTVLNQPELFAGVIDWMAAQASAQPIDAVVGIESRGFMLGAALAYKLGTGFVPIRKKGKLPAATLEETYELEYGTDHIQIHKDAIPKDGRVLLVDDLLATGGTMTAAVALMDQMDVSIARIQFMVDLAFLSGRNKVQAKLDELNLGDTPIEAMVLFHD